MAEQSKQLPKPYHTERMAYNDVKVVDDTVAILRNGAKAYYSGYIVFQFESNVQFTLDISLNGALYYLTSEYTDTNLQSGVLYEMQYSCVSGDQFKLQCRNLNNETIPFSFLRILNYAERQI